MKNLIKLQSIIMMIESDPENKYKSEFNFISNDELEILTPFWEITRLIKDICETMYHLSCYVKGNTKLKVLEAED